MNCLSCGDAIPYGPVCCPACIQSGACSICGLSHRAWQCPEVKRARLEMEQAETLIHRQIIADAARAIRERFEHTPIWQEAA